MNFTRVNERITFDNENINCLGKIFYKCCEITMHFFVLSLGTTVLSCIYFFVWLVSTYKIFM